MIKYGDTEVPVLQRDWKRNRDRLPYRKTYLLKPGDSWHNAPTTTRMDEHYVQLAEGLVPVGTMVIRDLMAERAICAVFTECWGRGCILMGPDLVCVRKEGQLGTLLDDLRAANRGSWAGLPDAIALFPDGRVVMREAKVAKRDRISKTQHTFAQVARGLLGDRLHLSVVEWGYEVVNDS